jgi:hypothetical protein
LFFIEHPDIVIFDDGSPEALCCGENPAVLGESVSYQVRGLTVLKNDPGIKHQIISFPKQADQDLAAFFFLCDLFSVGCQMDAPSVAFFSIRMSARQIEVGFLVIDPKDGGRGGRDLEFVLAGLNFQTPEKFGR